MEDTQPIKDKSLLELKVKKTPVQPAPQAPTARRGANPLTNMSDIFNANGGAPRNTTLSDLLARAGGIPATETSSAAAAATSRTTGARDFLHRGALDEHDEDAELPAEFDYETDADEDAMEE